MRVIDTLTQGFNLTVGALAALAIAAALDLLYWLGPRLVLGDAWRDLALSQLQALPVDQTSLGPLQDVIDSAGRLNLLQVLSGALGFGGLWPLAVPSLLAGAPEVEPIGPAWPLSSPLLILLVFLALTLVGIFIGSLYLTLVARAVRRERVSGSYIMSRVLVTTGWIMLLDILLFVVVFLVSIPLTLALLVANLVHPTLAALVGLFAVTLGVWLWLHGVFTLPAIVLDGLDPVRGFWRSFQLVQRNLWATLGLLGLSLILSVGLGELWRLIGELDFAVPVAILGNAFVGTALTAAMMVFYLDRQKR